MTQIERERYQLLAEVTGGDKNRIRLKIIEHILSSPKSKSYLSEMEGQLGFTRRTLLFHLAYLVSKHILSAEYQTVPIGEEQRPVVIKWYTVNDDYKWLRTALDNTAPKASI